MNTNFKNKFIDKITKFKKQFILISIMLISTMLALSRFSNDNPRIEEMKNFNIDSFDNRHNQGKKAEANFKKYVREYSKYTLKEDVSENPKYYKPDIDMLVLTPKGKEITVEVKKMKNDKLELEDTVLYVDKYGESHKKLGNIWYSKADYFAFSDYVDEKVFIIKRKALKNYYMEHHKKYESLPEYHYVESTKTNQLKFIPLADIIELGYYYDMGDEWS